MAFLRSAILPALAGYLFTFYNTKKTDERKAQIERCNDQVRLLYGPLLACVTATRSAYAAMVRQHAPDGQAESFMRAARECPEGPEGVAYRHWMRCVLQPLNEKAADVIVNHLNLLESTHINPLLLQFVAHVSAYRVILRRWEEGAIGEWSVVTYPDKLPEYVEREFKRIKRKQADLLGIKTEQRRSRSSRMSNEPHESEASRQASSPEEFLRDGTVDTALSKPSSLSHREVPRPKL